MAHVSDEDDPNDIVLTSLSLTAETTTATTQLPTLPFDVLPEILCRLPVKLLVQLRCLCKFFNSLISDPKFAKKHLQLSTKRHHLRVTSFQPPHVAEKHYDSLLFSVFSTSTVIAQTQLYPPISTLTNGYKFVELRYGYKFVELRCSCDGIFCGYLEDDSDSYFLWNPSIKKFKLLPPLENPAEDVPTYVSFGYDHFIDNYKVVIVSVRKEVSVYTLGTDYWKQIESIPYDCHMFGFGIFVSDTVNWFAKDDSEIDSGIDDFILSLDLEKESYQQLFLPNYENEKVRWILGMVRDCLCVSASSDIYWDVWIMKEYGNKESWTKLYTIPNLKDRGLHAYSLLYISEDDQLLVECDNELVVYDPKTGTLNIPEFQNNYELIYSNVYIESLISP